MTLLRIDNDGPAIISTNYWDSDYASAGAVFLSVNANAFRSRILSPIEAAARLKAEMKVPKAFATVR
jgi:hypothetical protein